MNVRLGTDLHPDTLFSVVDGGLVSILYGTPLKRAYCPILISDGAKESLNRTNIQIELKLDSDNKVPLVTEKCTQTGYTVFS